MSNETFAARLGIGVRTVASWHQKPTMRPRPDMQQILDEALAQASAEVKERFAVLTGVTDRTESVENDTTAGDAQRVIPQPLAADTPASIVSGNAVTIDARTIHLPAEAVQSPAEITATEGLHNLPGPHSPVFVDRHEDLARLDGIMSQQLPAAPPVVHGLGGTGKSTLALHFAHRSRELYNPIWWIPADSPSSVTTGLAELAARLNPYENITAKTSAEAAAWAIGWLQSHQGWLLVFDDADSPDSIEPLLGTLGTGRHLITSRRAIGWHRVGRPLSLTTLPADAATDLLMQIAGPDENSEQSDFECLAEELGYLPLALEQAAAYMQYTAITPSAYLDRLRRYPARMFVASAVSQHAGEANDQHTIARIWQLSLQALSAAEPLTGDILRTFAWFSPEPIPRDLVYGLDDDPLRVDEALALLHAYSMITLTPQSVTIHRLVQAVARIPDTADPYRTPDAIAQAREHATDLLLEALPGDPLFNVPGWPRWRELLPHVLAFADHIGPGEETPGLAGILRAASGFMQSDGHFDQAIASAHRAVGAYQRMQGNDAPDSLAARSFLASAYRAAGDLATAAVLHHRNVTDCERLLGADHPDTLVARANLAYLYALQDRPARALDLHQRNLADYERVLGPDHPYTVNARANLASSYRALGDLTRAISLHQQSVADYARVFGPDHSETITARSNLAYAYQLAGDFSHAIPLHQQVLTERERLYGPDHPYTQLARQLVTTAEHQASEHEPPDD